jgi:SAM-dependent methyltransferase
MRDHELASVTTRHLFYRDDDPNRPSLENCVAYQWEEGTDTLAHRSARLRDDTILQWSAHVLERGARPARVLDVSCAYGNLLLKLNAFMGYDQEIHYTGIDIDDRGSRLRNAVRRIVGTLRELQESGFALQERWSTPVMSGSKWFDAHPFLLTGLIGLEAIHSKLQHPSWAHGVCLQLRKVP